MWDGLGRRRRAPNASHRRVPADDPAAPVCGDARPQGVASPTPPARSRAASDRWPRTRKSLHAPVIWSSGHQCRQCAMRSTTHGSCDDSRQHHLHGRRRQEAMPCARRPLQLSFCNLRVRRPPCGGAQETSPPGLGCWVELALQKNEIGEFLLVDLVTGSMNPPLRSPTWPRESRTLRPHHGRRQSA